MKSVLLVYVFNLQGKIGILVLDSINNLDIKTFMIYKLSFIASIFSKTTFAKFQVPL